MKCPLFWLARPNLKLGNDFAAQVWTFGYPCLGTQLVIGPEPALPDLIFRTSSLETPERRGATPANIFRYGRLLCVKDRPQDMDVPRQGRADPFS